TFVPPIGAVHCSVTVNPFTDAVRPATGWIGATADAGVEADSVACAAVGFLVTAKPTYTPPATSRTTRPTIGQSRVRRARCRPPCAAPEGRTSGGGCEESE